MHCPRCDREVEIPGPNELIQCDYGLVNNADCFIVDHYYDLVRKKMKQEGEEIKFDKHAAMQARLNQIHARARDAFFITYLGCYQREQPQGAGETVAVAGALAGALMSVAGTIAVDLNIPEEAFLKIAKESYTASEAGAPKWA